MQFFKFLFFNTNENIGEKGGIWKFFEDEARKQGSEIPILKVWCSAHRMDLVWNDVTNSHKIVKRTLESFSSIASYFHLSALRVAELNKIADENKLELFSLPKIFEIRWSQFTHSLLHNLLRSWHALVIYFKINEKEATASGYAKFLTNLDNLKTAAFLADILSIFQRYHRRIQSNDLTLLSLAKNVKLLQAALTDMKEHKLIGG